MENRNLFTTAVGIVLVGIIAYTGYSSFSKSEATDSSKPQAVEGSIASSKDGYKRISTKADVEEVVKEFIMNNPEVLLKSVEEMQLKKAKEESEKAANMIKAKISEITSNADDPSYGPADAKVTVVEFFDYNCGFCKKMLQAKSKLVEENPDVRVIFKELPILGEPSLLASKAAIAANMVDKSKYWNLHTQLLLNSPVKDKEALKDLIGKVGLDAEKVMKTMDDPKVSQTLENNRKLAMELGIGGTPAYIIGDTFAPGALTYEDMKSRVEEARKAKAQAEQPAAVAAPVEKAPEAPAVAPTAPTAPAAPIAPEEKK